MLLSVYSYLTFSFPNLSHSSSFFPSVYLSLTLSFCDCPSFNSSPSLPLPLYCCHLHQHSSFVFYTRARASHSTSLSFKDRSIFLHQQPNLIFLYPHPPSFSHTRTYTKHLYRVRGFHSGVNSVQRTEFVLLFIAFSAIVQPLCLII